MCMLSYLPAGIEVDELGLLNGGLLNADGSGWAIASDNGIVIGKSLKVEEALDSFIKARKRYPDSPALFHSRWATHGEVNLSNVHPFFMGGSTQTVVAHNGILQCQPNANDPRSDTRLFADEILPNRFKRLDKQRAFDAMTKFCGYGNKLVILTTDPRYQRSAYIVNEKAGNWDDLTGIWHSNYDYLGYVQKTYTYKPWYENYKSTGTKSKWADPKTYRISDNICVICQMGEVGKGGFCRECGTCEDCLETREECQCWVRYANDWRDDSWPTTIG